MTLHTHPHFGTSWKEARLCYEVNTLETLEKGRDFLTSLSNLSETQASEKLAAIGNAQRPEYWKEALNGLDAQVQAAIVGNLENLEKRTGNTVTKSALKSVRETLVGLQQRTVPNVPVPSPEPPKNFIEKTGEFVHEVKEDFMEGGWKGGWGKKSAYIATGFFGFIAARYLWKKAFGSEGKEGFVKKSLKWMASIVGVGLGILGIKSLIDWWEKKTSSPWGSLYTFVGGLFGTQAAQDPNAPVGSPADAPPTPGPVADTFNAGRDIAQGAGGEVLDAVSEPVANLGNNIVELFQSDSPTEALKQIAVTGLTLVWDGGKFVLTNEGKMITKPFELSSKVLEGLKNGEMPDDLWMVYGATGAVYFMHRKLVDVFMGRMGALVPTKASLIKVPLRIVGWPFEAMYRGVKTGIILRRPDGGAALLLNLKRNSIVGKILNHSLESGLIKKISTTEEALAGVQKYERLLEEIRIIDEFDDTGFAKIFTKTDLEKVNNVRLAIAKSLRDFGRGFKGVLPSDPVLRAVIQKAGNPDMAKYMEDVGDALGFSREAARESAATAAASVTTEPLKIFADSTEPVAVKVQSGAPTTEAKTGATIVDDGGPLKVVQPETAPIPSNAVPDHGLKIFDPGDVAKSEGAVVETAGKAAATAEAAAAAEGAGEISATLKQSNQVDSLLKHPGFKNMLFDASVDPETARKMLLSMNDLDADALIRISRSQGAKQLLVGAMQVDETVRAQEMSRVMNAAKNSKIMMGMNLVGAGADMLGCVMCMIDYIGNEGKILATQNEQLRGMYLTAKPIIVAEGATSFTGLVIGSIVIGTHLKAGASLATALAAGTSWVMLPIGLAAAFTRATHTRLVESVEYHTLSEQELMPYSPGALLQDVNSTSETSRLNYSQTFADYFHVPDGGHYDPESANRGARDERYRAYFSQVAVGVVPQVMLKFTDIQGKTPEQIMQARDIAQKDEYRRFVANAMAYLRFKSSKTFETVSPEMLHDAQLFAQNAPPEQWGLTPAEAAHTEVAFVTMKEETQKSTKQYLLELCADSERFQMEFPTILFNDLRHQLAHMERKLLEAGYTGFNDAARNKARGYVAYRLWDILRDLGKNIGQGSPLPEAQLNIAISNIHELLATDPDRLALAADSSKNVHKHEAEGSNPLLLTVDSLSAYANRYRLTKPETLGTSELTALPLESLRLYQAERLRGKMPFLIKLKPGAKEGYLLVSENLWTRSTSQGKCTEIGGANAVEAVQLKPGVHRFWRESSMPLEGAGPVMASSMPVYSSSQTFRVLPTPTRPPDFEVIVEQAA